jgi:tryptophan synthase beta chain
MAPLISQVCELGHVNARAYLQLKCFEAGIQFAKAEGIIPAPEANHAVSATIDEALRCKLEGKSETILFNLNGHGNYDMQAYTDYFAGKLYDQ